jgi:hypothetical protein
MLIINSKRFFFSMSVGFQFRDTESITKKPYAAVL